MQCYREFPSLQQTKTTSIEYEELKLHLDRLEEGAARGKNELRPESRRYGGRTTPCEAKGTYERRNMTSKGHVKERTVKSFGDVWLHKVLLVTSRNS